MFWIINNIICGSDNYMTEIYKMYFLKRKLDGSLTEIFPDINNPNMISNRILKFGFNFIDDKIYECIDDKTIDFLKKYRVE